MFDWTRPNPRFSQRLITMKVNLGASDAQLSDNEEHSIGGARV
jgi:hypothetical protein